MVKMKELYLALIIGVLLIGVISAGIIISQIKPELTPIEIQKLKDCGFDSKYHVEKEWIINDVQFVIIKFEARKQTNLISWQLDDKKTFEQQLKEHTEKRLRELGNCDRQKDTRGISKEIIDIEK